MRELTIVLALAIAIMFAALVWWVQDPFRDPSLIRVAVECDTQGGSHARAEFWVKSSDLQLRRKGIENDLFCKPYLP